MVTRLRKIALRYNNTHNMVLKGNPIPRVKRENDDLSSSTSHATKSHLESDAPRRSTSNSMDRETLDKRLEYSSHLQSLSTASSSSSRRSSSPTRSHEGGSSREASTRVKDRDTDRSRDRDRDIDRSRDRDRDTDRSRDRDRDIDRSRDWDRDRDSDRDRGSDKDSYKERERERVHRAVEEPTQSVGLRNMHVPTLRFDPTGRGIFWDLRFKILWSGCILTSNRNQNKSQVFMVDLRIPVLLLLRVATGGMMIGQTGVIVM